MMRRATTADVAGILEYSAPGLRAVSRSLYARGLPRHRPDGRDPGAPTGQAIGLV